MIQVKFGAGAQSGATHLIKTGEMYPLESAVNSFLPF